MAIPTVHYYEDQETSTGNSNIDQWMPQLHALLIAAGWTCEYIDADAIGAGDASNPAWDKTPVLNAVAGTAVYRMPLNDQTTQWFVKLQPGWGNNVGYVFMKGLQVGTTHDGSGNLGGVTDTVNTAGSSINSSEGFAMATSEDGFTLLISDASTGQTYFGVERVRLLDGTVQDDIFVYNAFASAGSGKLISAVAGTVRNDTWMALVAVHGHTAGTSTGPDPESRDNTSIGVLGPYITGGYPYFILRLVQFASRASVNALDTLVLNIDGANHTYKAPLSFPTTWFAYMIATD